MNTDSNSKPEFSLEVPVILVEGSDELAVVRKLLDQIGHNSITGVVSSGVSLMEELNQISIQIERRKISTFGLVFDKESGNGMSQYESAVRTWLKKYNVNQYEFSNDWIKIQSNGVQFRFGAFMVENCLEDLFLPQVPTDIMACIDTFINCHGMKGSTQAKRSKQILRTYLSCTNSTNTSINSGLSSKGDLLKARALSLDFPEFSDMKQFLTNLM